MSRLLRHTIDYGGLDPDDDEFASIEDFVEYLCDDDRTSFDWRELNCLNARLRLTNRVIRRKLESWGLTLAERPHGRQHRGFRSNPHDRWYGPGSCPSHGGSGWSEITGMAGKEG